jgi:hypothetical protein
MRVDGRQPGVSVGNDAFAERRIGPGKSDNSAVVSFADNGAGVSRAGLPAEFRDRAETPRRANGRDRDLRISLIGELRHPHHGAGVVEVECPTRRQKFVECVAFVVADRQLDKNAHRNAPPMSCDNILLQLMARLSNEPVGRRYFPIPGSAMSRSLTSADHFATSALM